MFGAIAGAAKSRLYYLDWLSAPFTFDSDTGAVRPVLAFRRTILLLVAFMLSIFRREHLTALFTGAVGYADAVKATVVRAIGLWISSIIVNGRELLPTMWAGSGGGFVSIGGVSAGATTELTRLILGMREFLSAVEAYRSHMATVVEAFFGAVFLEAAEVGDVELLAAVRAYLANSWLASVSHSYPSHKELPAGLGTVLLSRQHSGQREAKGHYGVPVCVA